ncbi:hypothetical protein HanHA300_Chr02g0049881 [Helianthus annuus]|nr:hypothetical protein HanHA300_Chr02g0049881 [Helianthus annuus]
MSYKPLDSISISDIVDLGIPPETATQLHEKLTEIIKTYGSNTPETWTQISTRILDPGLPFSFHQMMYYGCYVDFGPDPPAWLPHLGEDRFWGLFSVIWRFVFGE